MSPYKEFKTHRFRNRRLMKPKDFQGVFELMEKSSEFWRIKEGLSTEHSLNKPSDCWGPEDRRHAKALAQTYSRWRSWLESKQEMEWRDDNEYLGRAFMCSYKEVQFERKNQVLTCRRF